MSIWGASSASGGATYYNITGDVTYNITNASATATAGTIINGMAWYQSASFWTGYGKQLEQKLKDKHEGMPLEDFLEMWRKDGYLIVDLETKELEDGNIAKRYNVYSEERLNEYGNHLGFVVIIDRVNKVMHHDIFNIRGN